MSYKSNTYLKEYEEYRQNIMSDNPTSTDAYLYSNSKMMNIYGHGKGFHVEDNLVLYEVVKLIKDIIDRHFYQSQIGLKIDVGSKKAIFHFILNKKYSDYQYVESSLQELVFTKIVKTYDDYFIVTSKQTDLEKNNVELAITVKINDHKDEE